MSKIENWLHKLEESRGMIEITADLLGEMCERIIALEGAKKPLPWQRLIGGIAFTEGEYLHIRKHIGDEIALEIEELQCDPRTCEDYRKGDECYNKNALIELTAMVARGER